MKSIEVSANGGKHTIGLHAAVTVLRVGGSQRDAIANALAERLGASLVVRLGDLPTPPADVVDEASPDGAESGASAGSGEPDIVDAEAAVAIAEAAVGDARAALEIAQRAYTAAQDSLLATNRSLDRDAADAVAAAEARLEVAQAGAAAARRALVQAQDTHAQDVAIEHARTQARRERIKQLHAEKAELDEKRTTLVTRLGELTPAPDPASVEAAVAGLHRLQQVKPRPSERAIALADSWAELKATLATLPAPPAPPEWLVTPALAALHEAREALARAEGQATASADPALLATVERAHREVLESEQRVMRRGNRANRRRLESAQEAEAQALTALGVSSYGDYLQRFAPDVDSGSTSEQRIAEARAALADAEAVWEELHGGEASPEYTAAKEREAELRVEAHAVLGEEVDDAELEARLRVHVETVVDTEWAERQLADALEAQGVTLADGDDLEQRAAAWLEEVPGRVEEAARVEAELGAIDARLHEVDAELNEYKTEAFFGQDDVPRDGPAEESGAGVSPPDPFASLAAALADAEAAEAEADAALKQARGRVEAHQAALDRVGEEERNVEQSRAAVDVAASRLAEAEQALGLARSASSDAAAAAEVAREAEARAAAERAAEAAARADERREQRRAEYANSLASQVWLLARISSARATASKASEAPLVIDARTVLSDRGLRLLERATSEGQVLVLGDEDAVHSWAAGLGDRAAIRTM